MERLIDEIEEIHAVRRESLCGAFAGESGEQRGINRAIGIAHEPLGKGANEGGKAGVIGWLGIHRAGNGNRCGGLTGGKPFDGSKLGSSARRLDFNDQGGDGFGWKP